MNIYFKDLHYSAHIATIILLLAILIVVLSIRSSTKNILISIDRKPVREGCPACSLLGEE
jgi:hypothetical protein|tara:strand:+ start:585 stop:764 length:180 start_codon:yes stop_codon:yes gene_type:complete